MRLVNSVLFCCSFGSHVILILPSLLPSLSLDRTCTPLTCTGFFTRPAAPQRLEAKPQALQVRGWWGEGKSP